MLYPELFKAFEDVRWTFERDVPWDAFRPEQLGDEQARSIKMNAITEWAALPATEMFLRDNRHDSDFSAFMSIWFYEEQKHALVLMEYLKRFRPDLVPTRRRAPRGALRVRSRAAARNADAAFLRRDPAEPLVPAGRRMAQRARHQADLRAHFARRGAPRRRLPAFHEARARKERRGCAAGVREDRRADGEPAARRQAAASDQPARESQHVPARHDPEPASRSRRGSSAGSISRSASTASGRSASSE